MGEGPFQRHFGSDQSVWRDGDWNDFVRIALAGLLAPLVELARGVGHHAPKRRVKIDDRFRRVSLALDLRDGMNVRSQIRRTMRLRL